MSILDEYRRNAEECQRMAEKAGNDADKASWLKLAASWLGLIKNEPRSFADAGHSAGNGNGQTLSRAWPPSSEKDSKASH